MNNDDMMHKGYKCSSSPPSGPPDRPPEGLVQVKTPPQCAAIKLWLKIRILSAHYAFFAIFFRFFGPAAEGRRPENLKKILKNETREKN